MEILFYSAIAKKQEFYFILFFIFCGPVVFYFVMQYTGNQTDRVNKKSNMRPNRVYKAAYPTDSNVQTKILVQIAREHKYKRRTT